MRKLRVRVGRWVTPLIYLGIALCFLTMTAPGFTFFGRKCVDLEYGDRLRVSGGYETIWRLRFNRLTVEYESPYDRSRRRNGQYPFYRFVSRGPAIEPTHPLTLMFHGAVYPIGDITPDLIRSLGGQVNQPPFKGDSFGHLMIPATPTSGAGYILMRFRDGTPVTFTFFAQWLAMPPAGVGLSFGGGPMLQLPATEDEVRRAFGEPDNRDDRVTVDKTQLPIIYSEPLPMP